VLKNCAHRLQLGYFCVLNPSQQNIEEGRSDQEALAKETAFFKWVTYLVSYITVTT